MAYLYCSHQFEVREEQGARTSSLGVSILIPPLYRRSSLELRILCINMSPWARGRVLLIGRSVFSDPQSLRPVLWRGADRGFQAHVMTFEMRKIAFWGVGRVALACLTGRKGLVKLGLKETRIMVEWCPWPTTFDTCFRRHVKCFIQKGED
jgi:hypothetical protein